VIYKGNKVRNSQLDIMKIHRVKVKDGYEFHDEKHNTIKDKTVVDYATKLVIPPAYNHVIIYYSKVPRYYKLSFTGIDAAGRKQYIYQSWWVKKAKTAKFCDMIEFAQDFPKIEAKINAAMKQQRLSKNKLIALMMKIILHCNFRIGNTKYAKLYKSYGISTLEKRHVTIKRGIAHIKFIGKKGVLNECVIEDKVVADNLKKLTAGKKMGDKIFLYAENKQHHFIKHTEINDWLKEINPYFTSKMFRIYQANMILIKRLRDVDGRQLSEAKRKKHTVQVYKEVAEIIHNTPAISKKDYCDSEIADLYIEKPRAWNNRFGSGSERVSFINWLKAKC